MTIPAISRIHTRRGNQNLYGGEEAVSAVTSREKMRGKKKK
jgi:hypothetical protein